MPAFEGDRDAFAAFEEADTPADPGGGLPASFDAESRDRFITSELDRLGLAGSQRTQKQNRMLTVFRAADKDGDGQIAGDAERGSLARGLIAGSQADAISQQLSERFASQAAAITKASDGATGGNIVARGFNSLLNVFNHNMDEMDQARDNAVRLLRSELPQDLARFNDMVAAAGGDPARIAEAESFLQGSLARAQTAGAEFDRRVGDFRSSNKFWSGLAADVGAGLLVLGGTALAVTGFGAPVGAGLIAAGFAVGGAASVGAHALLDNQYDFRGEALGNFLVGGISAVATVATAGAAAGVTTGLGSSVARYAGSQATTAGLTSFAQEGASGFQDGWVTRVVVGTAAGAALGRASAGVAGGITTRLLPQSGGFVGQTAARSVGGAAAGAISSGGAAAVNETISAVREGGFQDGAADRILQQTLGGAVAGGVQAAGQAGIDRLVDSRFTGRQVREEQRLARLDAEALDNAGELGRVRELNGPTLPEADALVALSREVANAATPEARADARARLASATAAAAGEGGTLDAVRARWREDLLHAGDADGAGPRQGDGPGYVDRGRDDLYRDIDPALRAHLEAAGREAGMPLERPDGAPRVYEQTDFAPHLEVMERLLARRPEALSALYDSVYESVGINPRAAEALIYDYTHSASNHNPETFYAIQDAVEHALSGQPPRTPQLGPDGQPALRQGGRDNNIVEYPADFRYDEIVRAVIDTRAARSGLIEQITGIPAAAAVRTNRGTNSANTLSRLIAEWEDPTRAQVKTGNRAVASSTLDAAAARDFGVSGPRSKTVQSAENKAVGTLNDLRDKPYVTYDFDVDNSQVLFDRLTDGYFSSEGLLAQRAQNEFLVTTRDALTTDRSRAQVIFQGTTYGPEQVAQLRTALDATGISY